MQVSLSQLNLSEISKCPHLRIRRTKIESKCVNFLATITFLAYGLKVHFFVASKYSKNFMHHFQLSLASPCKPLSTNFIDGCLMALFRTFQLCRDSDFSKLMIDYSHDNYFEHTWES